MYDRQLFHSWPLVILGGIGFSVLFILAALMVEVHFAGVFRFTRDVAKFGVAAFLGYVFVAKLIQRIDALEDHQE